MDSKKLSHAVPVFDQRQIVYTRQEKDGFITLMQKAFPAGMKLINSTANEIINLCDGSNSIDTIFRMLSVRYPGVNESVLKNDILETIIILDKNNIIKWKNKLNPFMLTQPNFEIQIDQDTRVYRACEDDFYDIYDFLNRYCLTDGSAKHKRQRRCVISSDYFMEKSGLYQQLFLRYRLFNYSERFYFLERNKEKIGMLSILDDYPISRRAMVTMLACQQTKDRFSVVENLFTIFMKDALNLYSKIKCTLSFQLPQVDQFCACLSGLGFVQEGILRDEYKEGEDILVYSKLLQGRYQDDL
jgi:hypothetical protein